MIQWRASHPVEPRLVLQSSQKERRQSLRAFRADRLAKDLPHADCAYRAIDFLMHTICLILATQAARFGVSPKMIIPSEIVNPEHIS